MSSKRYYWLKLKNDFFTNKKIKKLRKIAGGDTYTIIYLKMQLLSIKDGGKLYFENVEESFAEELALELDEDVDNVKVTLMFLIKNGLLIENNEEEFVLPETIECIGGESASAERVRRMRAKRKLLGEYRIDEKRYGGNGLKVLERDEFKCVKCGSPENICIHHNNGLSNELNDLITLCRKCHSNIEQESKSVTCNTPVTIGNTEIERDKEKEKKLDKEKESELELAYKTVAELYNNICTSLPKVRTVTPKRKDAITKLIRAGFTIEDLKNIFEKAEQSSFLKGENKNNWNASFDWLIKEENAVKVIEGNYINKPKKNTQKSSNPFVALALEMEN